MRLHCEISWGSLNKSGEELCGDSVQIVRRKNDNIIVLSDGLGSGVKANILSTLTAKIITTMLSAGAELRDVIETVTSTLPVCRDRRVAYSTFTIFEVDHLGNAYIAEYDNPPFLILRNGHELKLNRTVRSIADKEIYECHVKLEPDDRCVFFSDGVIHAGVGTLLSLGWQYENVVQYLESKYDAQSSAFELQSRLLGACKKLYLDNPGDDTTVAVCRMRTQKGAFLMIGPPVDPNRDESLVHELLSFDGYKVVCGGTTSQIVSRVSGRALGAELSYISTNIPPVGMIDGIDLVTEGVITLGKTAELLKRYQANEIGREDALMHNDDAAHLLARMLIYKCTDVKIAVGRALNPAHQNPNMSIDLSIKLRLVEDIITCLRKLDKEVEVIYN